VAGRLITLLLILVMYITNGPTLLLLILVKLMTNGPTLLLLIQLLHGKTEK
jgi:hypothetical protein